MSFKDVTRAWVLAILNLRERLGAPKDARRKFEEKGGITPEDAEQMLVEHVTVLTRGKVTTYSRMPSSAEVEAHRIFFPAEGSVGVGWWVLVGIEDPPEIYLLGVIKSPLGRSRTYALDRATRKEIPLPLGVTLAVPIKVLP